MKQFALSLIVVALCSMAPPALAANCFADYKAKQDNPLRLHYGVAQINGACTKDAARAELEDRLMSEGWSLLNVLAVFDEDGLDERKESAGEYYLLY